MNAHDLIEAAKGAAQRVEAERKAEQEILGRLARLLALPVTEHVSIDASPWRVADDGSIEALFGDVMAGIGHEVHARYPMHGVVVTVGDAMACGIVRMTVSHYTVRLLERELSCASEGMTLNAYDTEAENPLAARIRNIDYDYQAERQVIDAHGGPYYTNPARWVVRWELADADGIRARWERANGDVSMPRLTHAEPRFTGVRPDSSVKT